MKTSKILFSVTALFAVLILSLSAVLAVAVDSTWQDGAKSKNIGTTASATLNVSAISASPPITITVDIDNNRIYSDTFTDMLVESKTYTITQSQYQTAGTHIILITASDAAGSVQSDSLTLVVGAAGGANNAPRINSAPVLTTIRSQEYRYAIVATDADGNDLTYSLTTNPGWLTINPSTGLIAGITPSTMPSGGTYSVAVQVSDGTATVAQAWTITVSNNAPVLNDISDITVTEEESVKITTSATDPENDAITYSISDSRFSKSNNIFTWTTSKGDEGTYSFTVTASDGVLNSVGKTFTVTVKKAISDLKINSITLTKEEVKPNENLEITVKVDNAGNINEESWNIRASVSELGMSATSSRFDIDKGSSVTKVLSMQVPSGAVAGTYQIRVTFGNDVQYKSFTVKTAAAATTSAATTSTGETGKVTEPVASKETTSRNTVLTVIAIVLVVLILVMAYLIFINRKIE